MIKIETEKDGKINSAICGAPDEVIPEFFSLLHHIAKICMQGWTTRRICGRIKV